LLASNDRYQRLWHDYTTSFEWSIAAGDAQASSTAEGATR
jgi:hypothetical protein